MYICLIISVHVPFDENASTPDYAVYGSAGTRFQLRSHGTKSLKTLVGKAMEHAHHMKSASRREGIVCRPVRGSEAMKRAVLIIGQVTHPMTHFVTVLTKSEGDYTKS